MELEPVIGLEVHIHLSTNTKIFCGCSTKFGAEPNTLVCPVCLGFPGVLPVINKRAVELGLLCGKLLNCKISKFTKFDRKNYYYPDLPKAYQISQYDIPICQDGFLDIDLDGKIKRIKIRRVHLEEDAGKLVHSSDDFSKAKSSCVDYNRAGTPLAEIVTQPDINSPEEAYRFLVLLKRTMQYYNISDCNMEEGSMRCDVNISMREKGIEKLGVKTEIKNMNSFRGVEQALKFEIERQTKILLNNGKIIQETRLYNEHTQSTISMRRKEEESDYRYFPDPDLPGIKITDEDIEEISKNIRELPLNKKLRFIKEYEIPEYDAEILTANMGLADFYEAVIKQNINPKRAANFIISEILRELNNNNIEITQSKITPEHISRLLTLIEKNTISLKIAKDIFPEIFNTGKMPEEIVKEKNLIQIQDEEELESIIMEVLRENPKPVEDYCSGKKQVIGFLVGQVMKKTKGKASPQATKKLIEGKINEL